MTPPAGPAPRYELRLLRGEEVAHVEPVGPRGVRLGRAPANDLVIAHPGVSGHHAVVEPDGDGLVVTDLGSRNGTLVDGAPISGKVRVGDGARIVLGGHVALLVRIGAAVSAPQAWALEVGLVRHPLLSDRVRLGDGGDLPLPGAAGQATLLVVGDEVHLATDDDDVELVPDAPVVACGVTVTLRRLDSAIAATVPLTRAAYDYVLAAGIGGPLGPWAEVTDPATGRAARVDTENRAVLLWLLGRRWVEDAARAPGDRGWCTDDELLTAVWGREGAQADAGRVRVLLCRLRSELAAAGLDGNCLEKKRGHLRIRVGSARLE